MLQPEHKAAIQKAISSHDGRPLDQKKMLMPNAMVSKILIARYMNMPPDQQDALKQIFASDQNGLLEVILPEVKGLIKRGANA